MSALSVESPVDSFDPLSPVFLADASTANAEKQSRGCSNPIRLRGRTELVNTGTGEVVELYSSDREVDGYTYTRCGNRRASVCPSCSREYKGDAWHLLMCGLAGGRGIPADVATRPATFATLTAPSFGPVHGIRTKGACRARRDKPVCRHGRPAWCNRRHTREDRQLGEPLCRDCYDYVGHVLWQWHAPKLFQRFSTYLQRELARACGVTRSEFRAACKVSYSKVVEFQARAVVHFHVPIRLDGPEGPDGPLCRLPVTTGLLEDAVHAAAAKVTYTTPALRDGTTYQLRWGTQVDTRAISGDADRDSHRSAALVHPEQVAAYLAKYLTKTTEDFGLPTRVRNSLHARATGASPHAIRIIDTALWLAGQNQEYGRLRDRLATLGYRGHPITKSHAYSVTFGQIRRSRRAYRKDPGLDPDADIRQLLDDEADVPEGFELISSWTYVGQGYLDLDQAAAAVRSAAQARIR